MFSSFFGTGANAGMLAIHGQSPEDLFSWKTMVRSSGVWIESSSLPSNGPWYLSPPTSSVLW